MRIILLVAGGAFLLTGCEAFRAIVDSGAVNEVSSGALHGFTTGGPTGAAIGAAGGLLVGLLRAFQVGRKKERLISKVSESLGNYLKNVTDEQKAELLNLLQVSLDEKEKADLRKRDQSLGI